MTLVTWSLYIYFENQASSLGLSTFYLHFIYSMNNGENVSSKSSRERDSRGRQSRKANSVNNLWYRGVKMQQSIDPTDLREKNTTSVPFISSFCFLHIYIRTSK
jgi:hypothetical protein